LAKDGPVLLDALTGETLMEIKGKYNNKVEPFVLSGHIGTCTYFFDIFKTRKPSPPCENKN